MLKRKLKLNTDFIPLEKNGGDEFYLNGIFEFSITKMIEYIKNHSEQFIPVSVSINDFYKQFSSIDEDYMNSVKSTEPVILAEIAPERYNLIDGNHRMEKARRSGRKSIMAYKINMETHIKFLTNQKAYSSYVEYWNSKIEDLY